MTLNWQITQNFENLPREVFVFGGRDYLEAQKKAFESIYIVYTEWTENDKLHQAWMPIHIHKQGPFLRALTPPLSPYSGLISTTENIDLASLTSFLKKKFHFNQHHLIQYSFDEINPHCIPIIRTTLVWDYTEVFKPNRSVKRKLKVATELGLEVEKKLDIRCAAFDYYRVITTHQVKCPFDAKAIETFLEALNSLNLIVGHQVKFKDQTTFNSVCLVDPLDQKAYAFVVAPKIEHADKPSHYFLNHYFITENPEKWSQFDHCGADIESIAQFKRQFANKYVEYPGLVIWSSNSARFFYNFFRTLKKTFK